MRLSVLFLFLLVWPLASQAQDADIEKNIKIIDSLVYFNHFEKARPKIDSLKQSLNKQGQKVSSKNAALQLLYYDAYMNALAFKNGEALKIALDLLEKAKQYKVPEWEYKAHLAVAGFYEGTPDFDKRCKAHLDEAYELYKAYQFESLYSIYCIRLSSYYRLSNKKDSAIVFATRALAYAKKYNNKREKTDASLLLGMLYRDSNLEKSIHFSALAAKDFLHQGNDYAAAAQYLNIARALLRAKQYNKALLYTDSAYKLNNANVLARYSQIKQGIFKEKGQYDSAYHYLEEYHRLTLADRSDRDQIEIKKISEKYESEKKEALIKSKNQQFNFIGGLLILVLLATCIVLFKNHTIKSQNITIHRQLNELNDMLEIKKTLFSELQHRVKNNLQNIISLLEMQRESVHFNNIDERIRSSQNRIYSMALLHQKLDISKNIDLIKLRDYVNELALLVKDSYSYMNKNIIFYIDCKTEELSIQKAQPLGMIIVELISNSIKHAFVKQDTGTIRIHIEGNLDASGLLVRYADDGIGFDATQKYHEKGLGLGIIDGLIDQLNGKMTRYQLPEKGFAITIRFKGKDS